MTPNKLPPLPESLSDEAMALANFFEGVRVFVTSREKIKHPEGTDLFDEHVTRLIRLATALRQSQSLPAGAVAGLVGKWRDSSAFETDGYSILHRCATELEQAIQADAREKGEAVIATAMPDRISHLAKKFRGQIVAALDYATLNGSEVDAEECRVLLAMADADPIEIRSTERLATQPAQASEKADFWALERGCAALLGGSTWAVMPPEQKREARETLAAALATSSQETASE